MVMASHLDGINSLVPRWDPSNPTKYNYDPKNYNAADYAQFKEARAKFGQQQLKDERASLRETTKNLNKTINDFLKDEFKKQNESESKKNQLTRGQIKAAVAAGKTIWIDRPSTCFESVGFQKDSGAIATFWRGGDLTYTYPDVGIDEFLDGWASASSLGGFFNAEIRD
jgi:hypothetical protein